MLNAKQCKSVSIRFGERSLKVLISYTFPFIRRAWRFYIFEHYRGSEYAIPYHEPELHAYKEWFDHVFSLESVKRTLPDKARYLEHIGKYADASARSKVANVVRRGVTAHEIDDEKDTY